MVTPGRTTFVPESGHTNIYYTVEEWYPDAPVSERNIDVKVSQADISLPGSGNATIKFSAIGLDQTSAVTEYFTAPTVETTTEALAAANGLLIVNGASVAVVTDLSISINGNGTAADGVVGTNIRPEVFMGKLAVTGSFSAYFDGGSIQNLFLTEANVAIISALSSGSEAAADFMTFVMTTVDIVVLL